MASLLFALYVLESAYVGYASSSESTLARQYPLISIADAAATNAAEPNVLCRRQLKSFREAVDRREAWALRMIDSSGAPRNGLASGNNLWLGAYSRCPRSSSTEVGSRATKFPDFPPFGVDFYVGTFNATEEDVILIGLCLPSMCTTEDLTPILASWSARQPLTVQRLHNFSLEFRRVRAIRDGYIADYPLLIPLSLTIVLVVVLVVLGTMYDVYALSPKRRRREATRSTGKRKDRSNVSMRNIRESDEFLNRDNNLNDGYDVKIDNSLHKSMPVAVSVVRGECESTTRDNGILERFLVAFSAKANASTLVNPDDDDDNVPAVHGVRFFAMLWMICLHAMYYSKDYTDERTSVPVPATSTLSADALLFASGFFLSHTYYRNRRGSSRSSDSFSIKRSVNELTAMLVKRYLRLTPAYFMVLAVADFIFKRSAHTSLFEAAEGSGNVCDKYWWRNLFYVNNLFKPDEMCLSWSWYLSTEMQFFVLGSALVILSSRYWNLSAAITACSILVSSLINGYVSYVAVTLGDQSRNVHYPPWSRIGPYLIGMTAGYFVVQLKGKLIFNKATLLTCWLLGSSCGLWALFGACKSNMSAITTAAYNALSRPAWALGLAWIVLACTTDNAGIVNVLISYRGWIPFDKLTFTVYLLSPLVINLTYSSSESPIHLDSMIVYFFGFTGMAYCCAYVLSIALELPFMEIGKNLIGRKHVTNQLSRN